MSLTKCCIWVWRSDINLFHLAFFFSFFFFFYKAKKNAGNCCGMILPEKNYFFYYKFARQSSPLKDRPLFLKRIHVVEVTTVISQDVDNSSVCPKENIPFLK